MRTEHLIRHTLKGLLTTAIEKFCVLGEDAEEHVKQIREMYIELIRFWGLDEEYFALMEEFDEQIGLLK